MSIDQTLRLDSDAISSRVRGLITRTDLDEPEAVALRLGVSEDALRATIRHAAPEPALEVLAAIVCEYGVDPTWLLTGKYDSSTHLPVLDERGADCGEAVRELVARVKARRTDTPNG
jgi:hypothetical protein